tara:strand:- start:2006 stop:2734 length:729 start_codon:yes stop_codon:yes gene_type:complete
MIKQGDCLELLKDLDDDSIDLVITSPPYNMNLRIRYGKYLFRSEESSISTKYKTSFDDKMTMDEYYEFHLSVLKELLRVSDLIFYNVQYLTGNKRAIWRIMGELNEYLKEVVIWNKVISQPAMQPQVMNSQFENILIFDKTNAISRQFVNAPFDRGTLPNVWDIRREPSYDKKHKATFPKELVEKILDNFAHENQTILDPFMGLGTTGVVAHEKNMKFVGFELDDYYFSVAKKRLDEVREKQ